MSPNQLPESPVSPRRTFLPASFVAALSLALAACDTRESKITADVSPLQEETVAAPSPLIDTSTSA